MNIRSKITGEQVLYVTHVKQLTPEHVALAVTENGVQVADLFNATAEQIEAIENAQPSLENPVQVTVRPDTTDDLDGHPEVVSVG